MHEQGPLFLPLEFRDKQRQSGRSIGALNRHSQKSGRLVENDHGIVFVKHGKLPGETRPAPVLVGRNLIWLSRTPASFSRLFRHWLGAQSIRLSKYSADIANTKIEGGWLGTSLAPWLIL